MKPRLYPSGGGWGCFMAGTRLGFDVTHAGAYWHWLAVNLEIE